MFHFLCFGRVSLLKVEVVCHSWLPLFATEVLKGVSVPWGLLSLGPAEIFWVNTTFSPHFVMSSATPKVWGKCSLKKIPNLSKHRIGHSHMNIIYKTPWWFSARDIWEHGQIVYFPLLSRRLHALGQWYYANTLTRFFSKNELRALGRI